MLWQHTARTIKPFHARESRILPGGFDEPGFIPHGLTSKTEHVGPHPRQLEKNAVRPMTHRSPDQYRAAPDLARFDTRKARKIRAGRIEIEARLDLHGMRQAQAHGALRAFLLRSQARKLKWVLVITGKGTFARDIGALETQTSGFADWDTPQRGVLRRNVPIWLSEPDMRAVVVSYTTAAVHHGGEGALYIQLRSAKN